VWETKCYNRPRLVLKAAILETIYDLKTSNIFRTIASKQSSTDILISELKLTRKEYYTRISRLAKAGLVKREKGKYLITAFGRVIYSAYLDLETRIESAIKDYWKLKAIDLMNLSSTEENESIISTLIDNQEIKDVLLK
jgi:predicted transcriptional regulator